MSAVMSGTLVGFRRANGSRRTMSDSRSSLVNHRLSEYELGQYLRPVYSEFFHEKICDGIKAKGFDTYFADILHDVRVAKDKKAAIKSAASQKSAHKLKLLRLKKSRELLKPGMLVRLTGGKIRYIESVLDCDDLVCRQLQQTYLKGPDILSINFNKRDYVLGQMTVNGMDKVMGYYPLADNIDKPFNGRTFSNTLVRFVSGK